MATTYAQQREQIGNAIAAAPVRRHTVLLVNWDNWRSDAQVKREAEGMIGEYHPLAVLGCEAVGNGMGTLRPAGYAVPYDAAHPQRNNVVMFVSDDYPLRGPSYVDRAMTWPRTQGAGTHPARSAMFAGVGRAQFGVAHQAPRNARNFQAIQRDLNGALVRQMAPWMDEAWHTREARDRYLSRHRPRILGQDGNYRLGDHPGPEDIAGALIGGEVVGGERIDHFIVGGDLIVTDYGVDTTAGKVPFQSDHHRFVAIEIEVSEFWLAPLPVR